MAFFAVVHETGFKTRFDAGDDALINVGFTLFAAGDFNVDVDELLAVHDPHAGFFRMSCVDKHALQFILPGRPDGDGITA